MCPDENLNLIFVQKFVSCEAFHSKCNSIFHFLCDIYIKMKSTETLSDDAWKKKIINQKLNAYKNGQNSKFEFIKTV